MGASLMNTEAMIFHNGKIATMNPQQPEAQACAIAEDRVLAVGSDAEVMKSRGSTTQLIDLLGRTVIPGLYDSHIHVIRGGLNFNMELRWDGVPSLADA